MASHRLHQCAQHSWTKCVIDLLSIYLPKVKLYLIDIHIIYLPKVISYLPKVKLYLIDILGKVKHLRKGGRIARPDLSFAWKSNWISKYSFLCIISPNQVEKKVFFSLHISQPSWQKAFFSLHYISTKLTKSILFSAKISQPSWQNIEG